ncbi:uncharacterized protein LOC123870484 [Maniola jurtina]|uniref:uncharacterized protein LOC123870484 n=1 Tax=Maniola jurtina TaxID=191418 RepID=UPI001E68FD17|nr:uncharacterized protein LOC123870484 [Maniola jurtina]
MMTDPLNALDTKMWKIIPDDTTEPAELRELKLELANNTCKCKLCAIHNNSLLDIGFGCYDKEVQVKNSKSFKDRFPQTLFGTKSLTNDLTFRKDTFCPDCHIAMVMNLLSSKEARVLKDEESETKSEMFSCDKSTERAVVFAEKTTSTKEELKGHSELSLCDMMSEYSTDMSTYFTRNRKRNNEKVTFEEIPIQKPKVPVISRNCLCLENFVNSIRPPLAYGVMRFK